MRLLRRVNVAGRILLKDLKISGLLGRGVIVASEYSFVGTVRKV
jgi:hypothetical protein